MTFFDWESMELIYGKGHNSHIDWVDPYKRTTKAESPYGYDAFYIWRKGNLKDCDTVYHDRMQEWDWDKFREAAALVPGKRFDQFTRADANKFLSHYFDKKVITMAIAEGCNVSTGYPYWVFWFKEKKSS